MRLLSKKQVKKIDIYEHHKDDEHAIYICPALFAVDGFDKEYYKNKLSSNPEILAQLSRHTRQDRQVANRKNVFIDMSEGAMVTENLAGKVQDFCSKDLKDYSVCQVRHKNEFRKSSEFELEVFPIIQD